MDEGYDSSYDSSFDETFDADDLDFDDTADLDSGDDVGSWMDSVPETDDYFDDLSEVSDESDISDSANMASVLDDVSMSSDDISDSMELSEEIPEEIPEEVPEEIPEEMPEEVPEEIPEEVPEEIPEEVPEEMPEEVPEEIPEEIPEEVPEEVPEEMPEEVPEEMPEEVPEEIPEEVPEEIPEEVPDSLVDGVEMSPLQQMSDYMNEHNYGPQDYSEYSQDPEWQRLNNQLLQEQDIPPTAMQQMSDYMNEHNYGPQDYSEYSQDPEWQRLNDALSEAPDVPIPVTPYEERIDAVMPEGTAETEEISPPDGYFSQGNNEFGYEGTCGPTSIANGINHLLGEERFTENDVVTEGVRENLCSTEGLPEECGGTSTEEFVELYEHMNDLSGGKLQIDTYDCDQVLSAEEVADKLDDGRTVHVAVDADTLWGVNSADVMGTPNVEKATDHWITVTDAVRDADGTVTGFKVIDSGGGVDYVDAETYQDMCYGNEHLHLTDPTCIVVGRKDFSAAESDLSGSTAAYLAEIHAEQTLDVSVPLDQLKSPALNSFSDVQREVYTKALEEEPSISSDVQAICQATGSDTAGFENRIKSPESLLEKLTDRGETTDINNVYDILRYTQEFSPEKLTEGTNRSLEMYEQMGYTVDRVSNSWLDDTNPYNGINARLTSPTGQRLEVQFHTQDSFEVKNGPMHELYEQWRVLPEDSSQAIELQNRMFEISRQMEPPSNIWEVREK